MGMDGGTPLTGVERIIYESHRGYDYHGISIFLRDDRKWYDEYEDEYRTLDFAALHWDDFLETLYDTG